MGVGGFGRIDTDAGGTVGHGGVGVDGEGGREAGMGRQGMREAKKKKVNKQ